MSKGTTVTSHLKIYGQIAGLQHLGKSESEIAKILGLTAATVRYLVSINLSADPLNADSHGLNEDQRLKLAYQMRQGGKSMAEISQKLQVNIPKIRRMIHRHGWILRHLK